MENDCIKKENCRNDGSLVEVSLIGSNITA
jgi:hypothetical protein